MKVWAHHVEDGVGGEAASEHLILAPLPASRRIGMSRVWAQRPGRGPTGEGGGQAVLLLQADRTQAPAGKGAQTCTGKQTACNTTAAGASTSAAKSGRGAAALRAPEEGLDSEAQRAQRRHRQHLPPHKLHRLRAVLRAQRDVGGQAGPCWRGGGERGKGGVGWVEWGGRVGERENPREPPPQCN